MKNLSKLTLVLLAISLILSGCSGYKTTWDCPKLRGIGCSSLEYADEIARKQILLNTDKSHKKKVLIKRNENKFNKIDFDEAEIY